jgi:putative lipoprotein
MTVSPAERAGRRNPAGARRQAGRMEPTRRTALAAALILLAAPAGAAQDVVITGTAAYRERIALPPGAVLEVELRDISRADAPAPLLAATRVAPAGQVPIAFALRVDPARIDPRGRYAVSARLLVDGAVRWRADRVHPVLTGGAGHAVDLLLVRAAAGASEGLVGAWQVQQIAGQALPAATPASITFEAAGRAHGSGGCNRFTGGYAQQGAALRFDAMAQTNMACADAAMEQEARFHAALMTVRGWRIEDGRLLLVDAGGTVAIRLLPRG